MTRYLVGQGSPPDVSSRATVQHSKKERRAE